MFTKLRMSAREALEAFHKICEEVYVHNLTPAKRSQKLRKCLEDLLIGRGLPIDLKMGRDLRVEDACSGCILVLLICRLFAY